MLRNWNISTRILFGFTLAIITLLTIASIGVYALQRVQSEFKEMTDGALTFNREVQNTRAEMGNIRRFEKDIFINISKEEKYSISHKKWIGSIKAVKKNLDAAYDNGLPEEREMIVALRKSLSAYSEGFESVFSKISNKTINSTEDANTAMEPAKPFIHEMEEVTKNLSDSSIKKAALKENNIAISIKNFILYLGVLSVTGTLLCIALVIIITRSIRMPLNKISEAVKALSLDRNIRDKLPNFGANEVGTVAKSLNDFIDSIRSLIVESKSNSLKLTNVSSDLSTISQNISESCINQANSASACAAAIEQLTVSISIMGANANGVISQVKMAARQAETTTILSNLTAEKINEIAENIKETGSAIDALNKRSDEIGDIVAVIHDIAEQTNLLALNAAIEAARAGETGRGFAVVADEVRKLAERTSQATTEIASKIGSVQRDTEQAFQSMRSADRLILEGVSDTKNVSQELEGIKIAALESVAQVTEMVAAVNEQGAASQSIAQNMENIAQMNESTSQAIITATHLASGLKCQADDLNSCISKFIV